MGFNFNLILKKDAGSEPLVVGNMPLEEVYEIIGRELTVEQGERTASPGSPNVSDLSVALGLIQPVKLVSIHNCILTILTRFYMK